SSKSTAVSTISPTRPSTTLPAQRTSNASTTGFCASATKTSSPTSTPSSPKSFTPHPPPIHRHPRRHETAAATEPPPTSSAALRPRGFGPPGPPILGGDEGSRSSGRLLTARPVPPQDWGAGGGRKSPGTTAYTTVSRGLPSGSNRLFRRHPS